MNDLAKFLYCDNNHYIDIYVSTFCIILLTHNIYLHRYRVYIENRGDRSPRSLHNGRNDSGPNTISSKR